MLFIEERSYSKCRDKVIVDHSLILFRQNIPESSCSIHGRGQVANAKNESHGEKNKQLDIPPKFMSPFGQGKESESERD